MGVVWRAHHRRTGVRVAIKVLHDAVGQNPLSALQHEVRAAAGLAHPTILHVLDQGVASSDGPLDAGTPWFASEFASGGSLRDDPERGWPEVQEIGLRVLDALAHAHARGVLHRDLKPANLLWCTASDPRPGLKIGDWGLALRDGSPGVFGGTPGFMPPEQLGSGVQGPWTDIFGTGCVVWFLLCGSTAPYGWASPQASAFRPRCPVPPGLFEWLERCIHPNPARRWSCASDAMHSLAAIPAKGGVWQIPTTTTTQAASEGTAETWNPETSTVVPPVTAAASSPSTIAWPEGVPPDPPSDDVGATPVLTHAITAPEDWRPRETQPLPVTLFDAGLGLAGVRSRPVVGRLAEQDLLWREVRRTSADGRGRTVFITGSAGMGKSALARWLVERAEELGAAVTLPVRHSRRPAFGDGLAGALVRIITRRVQRDHQRARALRQLLDNDQLEPAVRALAASLAPGRILLVWVEDAQYGTESVILASRLRDLPVLVLATVQDEALSEVPPDAALSALMERSATVRLGPLDRAAMEQVISADLRVEPGLLSKIAERADGSPMLGTQLLASIDRSALVAGPHGFSLRAGVELRLPPSLRSAWETRIDDVLGGRTSEDDRALQLAATLGLFVRGAEWRAVCAAAGVPVSKDLVSLLTSRGLARTVTATDFTFAHAIVREALLVRRTDPVIDEARCSEAVRRLSPDEPERLGRHLLAAEAWDEAYGVLLGASRVAKTRLGHSKARSLHEACGLALERGGAGREDSRWLQLRLEEAETLLVFGQADAPAAVDRVAELISGASPIMTAHYHFVRGRLFRQQGRTEEALADLRRALTAYRQLGALNRENRASVAYAGLLMNAGRVDEAHRIFEEALACADTPVGRAIVLRRLATIHLARRDPKRAEECLRDAEATMVGRNKPVTHAMIANLFGEAARMKGRPAAAADHYRRAAELFRSVGYSSWPSELNLATMELTAGNFIEARTMVRETMKRVHQLAMLDNPHHVIELGCAAGLGEWKAVDEHLEHLQKLWKASGLAESDCAEQLTLAAERLEAVGQLQRAHRVRTLADQHRAALESDPR